MKAPTFPAALGSSAWERQAGTCAKAKGVTLGADLKDIEKRFDALDFAPLDVEKVKTLEELDNCLEAFSGEWGKKSKALCDALRELEAAAGKLDAQWRKDPAAKAAMQATATVVRAAATLRDEIERAVEAAGPAMVRRRAELREARRKGAAKEAADSPERKRLATRIVDQFRVVKNRPDRKVEYLLCLGRDSGAAYLGPTASDSHKPMLMKALRGDTGFKFFRGECIWEEGGYTFVGPRMSKTLARRIENAMQSLTGTRYRVRAREED